MSSLEVASLIAMGIFQQQSSKHGLRDNCEVIGPPNFGEEGECLGCIVKIFMGDVVKGNPRAFEGHAVFQVLFPCETLLLIFLIYQGEVKDAFYGLCGKGDAQCAISFAIGDVGLTSACDEIGTKLENSIEVEFEGNLVAIPARPVWAQYS